MASANFREVPAGTSNECKHKGRQGVRALLKFLGHSVVSFLESEGSLSRARQLVTHVPR